MKKSFTGSTRILVLAVIAVFVLPAGLFAQSADNALLAAARDALGVLPASMPSPLNPITPAKVSLGRMLYFETRISVDGTVSCSRCHLVGLYGTDGLPKAIGNNSKLNPRNAPTVLNAAAQLSEHWIGNRTSVEDQARQALIGPPSFGMPSYEAVVHVLSGIPQYVLLFAAAFPQDANPVSVDNFAKAVGAFERTLVTPAPFDAFLSGDQGAITARQKSGLGTFIDSGCAGCHSGAYLGGQMYQKFGVVEPYWTSTGSREIDIGRAAVTKRDADRYVFKVPILRNVAMTPPYFHDGSVTSLADAVRIMARVQLGKDLGDVAAGDIAGFLASLTGHMPDDLLVAPILPGTQTIDTGGSSR